MMAETNGNKLDKISNQLELLHKKINNIDVNIAVICNKTDNQQKEIDNHTIKIGWLESKMYLIMGIGIGIGTIIGWFVTAL